MTGHGGKRKGAGRPKVAKNETKKRIFHENQVETSYPVGNETPLEYLLRIMNDPTVDDDRRDAAAKSAAQYVHPKGDRSRKQELDLNAEIAAKGRFTTLEPPIRMIK